MSLFFIVLSHTITIAGICALCYAGFRVLVEPTVNQERVVRGIALVAGAFIYLAAKALGIAVPTLIIQSVEAAHWITLLVVGAIIPSLTGFLLIRYIMKCMKKDETVATRVMLMISALCLVMFADVYVVAVGAAKLEELKPLLPNVTFLLSMMCYIVFEYRPAARKPIEGPNASSVPPIAESPNNADVGIVSSPAPTGESAPVPDGLTASL
ncbi:MAG TPA: hypothetical protein VHC22_23470 [Pirellulales bacterium]|nr:hypothetical protein [Pirellulales bacterium]